MPLIGLSARADEELGYGDLVALVDEAAERLAGAGARPGERVALLGSNTVEWVVAFLAGLRLGAVVVPLNVRLGPLELSRQLAVCEPRIVLVTETLASLADRVSPASGLRVLVLERGMKDPRTLWRQPRARTGESRVPPAAPALISFTSGTTGSPKGAVVEHGALVRSASAFVPRLETTSADSTLVLAPLFHNTGFADQLSQLVLVGGAVDLLPEFRVADAVDALVRRPATYLIAVPSVFRLLMLARARRRRPARLSGRRLRRRVDAHGVDRRAGRTLARAPALQLLRPHRVHLGQPSSRPGARAHPGKLGRAPGRRRPPADRRRRGGARSRGVAGEVWLSGPMRMTGYFRDPVATREVFRGEWLRTGDVGSLDDDFLVLLGRSAEVINRGGEKIHAAQVEAALCELPAVADAAVVGRAAPGLPGARRGLGRRARGPRPRRGPGPAASL